MMDECSAGQPAPSFGTLLRLLRAEARLTQEELAEKAGLSTRSISDLERGVSRAARKETARLLADTFAMAGPVRAAFVAAARGRAPACDVLAAMNLQPPGPPPAATRSPGDSGVDLSNAGIGQLIDAIATAAGTGTAVAGIWLIGLMTVPASEATSAVPSPGLADAALASRRGQLGRAPSAGLRMPQASGHAGRLSGHGTEKDLPWTVATAVRRGAGLGARHAGRASPAGRD
jgi:transcriptional regulator with XRE-family HTH domain